MKKKATILTAVLLSMSLVQPVGAATLDYQGAMQKIEGNNQLPVTQNFADGAGTIGKMVVMVEPAYTQAVTLAVKETPDADARTIMNLAFGQKVNRVGLCDNGWSKVLVKNSAGEKVYGYAESYYLSDTALMTDMEEELTVVADADVLDFPGVRNGLKIGNVVENETVTCIGICTNEWSRIRTENNQGEEVIGFVPNSVLSAKKTPTSNATNASGDGDMIEGEAILQPGSNSSSIWARAKDEVTQEDSTSTSAPGVLEADAVQVGSGAKLIPLGNFRITHYCPCSICCGPWTDGITSTGVTAQTNHTIAVNPSQIPYGSKVVINGQVYVAEDCGGAIVDNCIDIYVATHEEGNRKGVFYTDVYLLEE